MIVQDKKKVAVRRLFPSIPARPSGPPLSTDYSKGKRKWLLFGLAVVLSGWLMKQRKVQDMIRQLSNL